MSEAGAFGLQWGEAEIGPGWQGIAALSFSEPPPPGFAVALSVRLAKPAAGLAPQDIAVTAPGGQPLEAEVMPVADGDVEITIRFAQQGPRGQTRVRLLSGGDDPLDPFFAEAGFDFFVACPAGDCREPAAPPPPPGVQPAIDLATKDFTGFLAVMQSWAAATDPNWAGTNPASTEAMLVELLAHHAEMLSLHQDRVAQEAFVDTARERLSLSRHAAALGLALDEGGSALAVVAVDLPPGRAGFLPAGTRFVREEGMGRITATFTSQAPAMLDAAWNAGLQRDADRGLLRLAAWPGAPDAILPAGARELLLWGGGARLLPGQRIALVQGRAAHVTRIAALSEISQPGWAADPSDPAHTLPRELTRLELAEPLPLPFRPWSDPEGAPLLITANLVEAIHGDPASAANEEGAAMGLGAGRQDIVTATDLLTGAVTIRALRTPQPQVLTDGDGRPSVRLHVGAEAWDWQPTLMNSAGFDRHFTTETEEDGAVWLMFGDGNRGRALPLPPGSGPRALANQPAHQRIRLDWRQGDAEAGNLGAFALTGTRPPGGGDAGAAADFAALAPVAATNLLPATGGRARVSTAVARDLIPESIRNPARARCVTAEDYARAAEDIPGVARAAAKPLGGVFNTIMVLCAPDQGDRLDAATAAAVQAHLDALRMAGREHVLGAPDYVALDLHLVVCPRAGAGAAAIRRALREALAPGSAARPGFFHPARRGFGDSILLSELLAAAARVPGVGAVKAATFRPLRRAGAPAVSAVIELGPTEIAQFSGDEARPERGRLTVTVMGTDTPPPGQGFVVAGPAPEPASTG
ncbi:baseplate J-like protein [Paracoccus pantotrophus]|uniref:Baseplate J-like protein n=1 Tax=Paracoccus pantotrophus TaxID=82367 RepID=A0AAE6NTW9_PARPN|nr:baseplate J/gp47 family protein [Paracoccus pantotrophus]QFG36304.1 hypothetical protein ESD82_08795 [Paracoccus pantotrophus]RKS43114.1 baseplate J-like protein [Paracoccus pantotrophus]